MRIHQYTFFSVYSLIAALLWVTVFTKIISFLRKKTSFLKHFSLHAFLFLLLFCLLRLLFPLELPYTVTLNSKKILPALQALSRKPLFRCGALYITPGLLLTAVWIAVAASLLLRHIREYRRLKRLLNLLPVSDDAYLYHLLAEANLTNRHKPIRIIVHASFASPTAVGYLHPVILLPDLFFDDDELLGIFLHETAHLRFRHHLVKLAIELVCICFWWDPFLKELYAEITHALEMHSDQAVCAKLNQEQQKKYLEAVIKVFRNQIKTKAASSLTCGLMEQTDGKKLQQRFRMILEGCYHSRPGAPLIAAALAFCVFLSSYTFVLWPFSEPTAADFGHVDQVPPDKFFYIETDDGYDVYEYPDRFIFHTRTLEPHMQGPHIYKNLEEAKKK